MYLLFFANCVSALKDGVTWLFWVVTALTAVVLVIDVLEVIKSGRGK